MSTITSDNSTPVTEPGYAGSRGREPRVMDHEYDGIREYDNPTPGWWHLIFVGSVIFSAFYILIWDVSPLTPTVHDQWKAAQQAEFRKLFGALGELKPDEPTIQKMRADTRLMEVAQGIFESNCAACHARDGGGINGVNLTDDYYKNVKVLTDILKVINEGAAAGAMPSWRNRLSDNERIITAAYVANLRGTTPKAPVPPAGEIIPPWPKLEAPAGQ